MECTSARRELAKLLLNSLYGKTVSSTDSSYKSAVGSGIISYAIISYAGNKRGFIYADTDGIHCDLNRRNRNDGNL